MVHYLLHEHKQPMLHTRQRVLAVVCHITSICCIYFELPKCICTDSGFPFTFEDVCHCLKAIMTCHNACEHLKAIQKSPCALCPQKLDGTGLPSTSTTHKPHNGVLKSGSMVTGHYECPSMAPPHKLSCISYSAAFASQPNSFSVWTCFLLISNSAFSLVQALLHRPNAEAPQHSHCQYKPPCIPT